MTKVNRDRFFVDLGIITAIDKAVEKERLKRRLGGMTFLWRRCCLEKVLKRFRLEHLNGPKNSKIDEQFYNWCFTYDIGSITMAPRLKNILRLIGVIYIQLYNMNKQPFDAVKKFPFSINDETLAYLAADDSLLESYRSIAGAVHISREACLQAFFEMVERIFNAVTLRGDSSFGVREEFRVSLNFLDALEEEWESQGRPSLRRDQSDVSRPYYAHPTPLIMKFTATSVYPYILWAEQTLASAPLGELSQDSQKMMLVISSLLKCSWGSALLSRHPLVYSKGDPGKDPQGLNMKYIMHAFRYAYLPSYVFHWSSNNITHNFLKDFPTVDHIIKRRHKTRWLDHKDMQGLLVRVGHIANRLKQMSADNPLREFLLDFLAMIVLREYIIEVFKNIHASPYEFTNKAIPPADSESEEEDEEDESHDQCHQSRKRSRATAGRRKLKESQSQGMTHIDIADRVTGVHKEFDRDEIPILLWESVTNELGEPPINTGRAKVWSGHTKKRWFDFVFLRKYKMKGGGEMIIIDVQKNKNQEWQRLRYLQAIEKIHIIFKETRDEFNEFINRLQKLFEYFCHCIPNHSRERWLGRTRLKMGRDMFSWLCFDQNGNRIQIQNGERAGSWLIGDRRIDRDWRWKLAGDGVLEVEPHEVNRRLEVLADGTRLYRDEENIPVCKRTTIEVVILSKSM